MSHTRVTGLGFMSQCAAHLVKMRRDVLILRPTLEPIPESQLRVCL